jgi:hypothetical protein
MEANIMQESDNEPIGPTLCANQCRHYMQPFKAQWPLIHRLLYNSHSLNRNYRLAFGNSHDFQNEQTTKTALGEAVFFP